MLLALGVHISGRGRVTAFCGGRGAPVSGSYGACGGSQRRQLGYPWPCTDAVGGGGGGGDVVGVARPPTTGRAPWGALSLLVRKKKKSVNKREAGNSPPPAAPRPDPQRGRPTATLPARAWGTQPPPSSPPVCASPALPLTGAFPLAIIPHHPPPPPPATPPCATASHRRLGDSPALPPPLTHPRGPSRLVRRPRRPLTVPIAACRPCNVCSRCRRLSTTRGAAATAARQLVGGVQGVDAGGRVANRGCMGGHA